MSGKFQYTLYTYQVTGSPWQACNPSYWHGGILVWLVDRELPKGSKWPAEGLHYTRGSTRGMSTPGFLWG